jgi:hypothetical protein
MRMILLKKVAGIKRHDANYSNRNHIQQTITSFEGIFLLKSQSFQLYAWNISALWFHYIWSLHNEVLQVQGVCNEICHNMKYKLNTVAQEKY